MAGLSSRGCITVSGGRVAERLVPGPTPGLGWEWSRDCGKIIVFSVYAPRLVAGETEASIETTGTSMVQRWEVMTKRRAKLGLSVLLTAVMIFGSVAQAAEQSTIYLARAIGEEAPAPGTQPPPAKKPPATTQKPVAETKPATTAETEPKSKGISKTWIWVGVGAAALLALAAGGGGGGGGSAVSH
jgi:hypothetical protein